MIGWPSKRVYVYVYTFTIVADASLYKQRLANCPHHSSPEIREEAREGGPAELIRSKPRVTEARPWNHQLGEKGYQEPVGKGLRCRNHQLWREGLSGASW